MKKTKTLENLNNELYAIHLSASILGGGNDAPPPGGTYDEVNKVCVADKYDDDDEGPFEHDLVVNRPGPFGRG